MPDQPPVLDQVNVVVDDMDAAVAFYRRLGLEVSGTVDAWQAHHRTVTAGGAIDLDLDSAAFAAEWGGDATGARPGVVLGFRLESREAVDRAYADLTAAGHRGRHAPWDAFWGARYAVVEDPSGNAVGLMSPQDPGRRTAPPMPPESAADRDDVGAAMEITERFMSTFNAGDAAGHAATLAYPHVRLASGRVRVWETIEQATAAMSDAIPLLRERAAWDHSEWDRREVVHTGPGKVHLDVQFTRYRADGSVIGVYPAVYVVVEHDGAWGIQCRSSYAP